VLAVFSTYLSKSESSESAWSFMFKVLPGYSPSPDYTASSEASRLAEETLHKRMSGLSGGIG